MPRIPALDPTTAPTNVRAVLDAVNLKLGMVPNLMKTMGQAPSVLDGYLAFSEAVGKGHLPAKLREQIALLSANANGCDYCASAHQALGKMVGLSADDIAKALEARASDVKAAAALGFAKDVIAERGHVSDTALAAVRAAGFSDGEILEIVANVVLNVFTNYVNSVAGTEVDFPLVTTRRAA